MKEKQKGINPHKIVLLSDKKVKVMVLPPNIAVHKLAVIIIPKLTQYQLQHI